MGAKKPHHPKEQLLHPDRQRCVPNSAPKYAGISSDGKHTSLETGNKLPIGRESW